ncbi:MAG: hypothetical protein QM632_04460 [Micrococcaceae bacterium]
MKPSIHTKEGAIMTLKMLDITTASVFEEICKKSSTRKEDLFMLFDNKRNVEIVLCELRHLGVINETVGVLQAKDPLLEKVKLNEKLRVKSEMIQRTINLQGNQLKELEQIYDKSSKSFGEKYSLEEHETLLILLQRIHSSKKEIKISVSETFVDYYNQHFKELYRIIFKKNLGNKTLISESVTPNIKREYLTNKDFKFLSHSKASYIVADDTTAFLISNDEMLLIKNPRLVQFISENFMCNWKNATTFYPDESNILSQNVLLTAQDKRIIQLLVHGLAYQQIAKRLGKSPRSIQRRVSHIMENTNSKNQFTLGFNLATGLLKIKENSQQ